MELFKSPLLHTKGENLKSRWYVCYYYKHPEKNKFERFTVWISSRYKTISARRAKGLQIVEQLTLQLKKGWSPFQQSEVKYTTVVEALEYILKIKKSELRKRSIETYEQNYYEFKKWLGNNKMHGIVLEQFTYKYAQMFFDFLKIEKQVKNRTYNNFLACLRTLYNALIKREYTNYNPFNKVTKLKIEQAEICPITPEELKLYHDYLSDIMQYLNLYKIFINAL